MYVFLDRLNIVAVGSAILFEWHSEIAPYRHGCHKLDCLEFLVTEVASL